MKRYFEKLDSMLQGRNSESKKEANNTYWRRNGHSIVLVLHETEVFSINPRGEITLSSGGYRTRTTKDRINIALPAGYYISQDKSMWYLSKRNDGEYVFRDGMKIGPKGKVYSPKRNERKEKAANKWVKKVNAFAKEMVERAFDGRMEAPSNGDC